MSVNTNSNNGAVGSSSCTGTVNAERKRDCPESTHCSECLERGPLHLAASDWARYRLQGL